MRPSWKTELRVAWLEVSQGATVSSDATPLVTLGKSSFQLSKLMSSPVNWGGGLQCQWLLLLVFVVVVSEEGRPPVSASVEGLSGKPGP